MSSIETASYTRFQFTDGPYTREVLRRGQGPAVLVIHEIPNVHPLVLRFADRVADAGHTVFLPSLTGEPGHAPTRAYAAAQVARLVCVRREFALWASQRSSPIVAWLRALARTAHAECGGPGVGVVGMCLTGNFALAMMTEPAVVAPVLSQPSLPLAMLPRNRAAIGISPDEQARVAQRLEAEDLSILGLRFHDDPLVPPERFATLRGCFGARFEGIELDPADAAPYPGLKPHSVLTMHLRDDDPTGPTKRAEARVLGFLRERLQTART